MKQFLSKLILTVWLIVSTVLALFWLRKADLKSRIARKLWGYGLQDVLWTDIYSWLRKPNLMGKTIYLAGEWYKEEFINPSTVVVVNRFQRDVTLDQWYVRDGSSFMGLTGKYLRRRGVIR